MTYEYHIIVKNKLPKGFKYPKSYLHYLKYNETQEEVREYGCWEERYMIRGSEGWYSDADFFYGQVMHEYPNETLVPFARLYDDEIFCFDGNDTSGDPAVYLASVFSNEYERIEPIRVNENFYQWMLEDALEGQEECGCWRADIPFHELPEDFTFPKEYLKKIKIPDIDSFAKKKVYFIAMTKCDDSYQSFRKVYDKIKHLYSNLKIVPFAKGKNDDLFVFDGNDTTGNPQIYLLNSKEKSITKAYANFEAWWNDLEENIMFVKENHEK